MAESIPQTSLDKFDDLSKTRKLELLMGNVPNISCREQKFLDSQKPFNPKLVLITATSAIKFASSSNGAQRTAEESSRTGYPRTNQGF